MFNEAYLIVSGRVAREPEFSTVGQDIPKLKMRVVWTTRRKDSATGEWVDGNTSGVNVTCWRQLAENLHLSLRKGDPVLVWGKLEVRTYVGRDGQQRTAVDVDAITVGPDLTRGVARIRRVPGGKQREAAGENGSQYATSAPGAAGDEIGDDAAALAAMAEGGLEPGAEPDDGTFDDSAIDELSKEADSVAAPF
jgi:single-strand DNA-binding protein